MSSVQVVCRVCQVKYPPYPRRHLCRDCWKLYGGRTTKDREPWVTALMNLHRNEQYYQTNTAPMLTSLDSLMEDESFCEESTHPIRSYRVRRKRVKKSGLGVHLESH